VSEEQILHLDEGTREFQYRMLCLQIANMAQEVEGDMNLEKVMERANAYWEFVVGVNHPDPLDIVRETIREIKGTA
jgi:hypothetical protein